MDATLSAQEVCKRIEATTEQLNAWIKQGLPHKGKGKNRRFSESQVAQWLIENGLAESVNEVVNGDEQPESNIADAVRTLAKIMNMPKLHRRTLCEWMKEPGFPGRPGRQGRPNDGYFPCRAIARWHSGRFSQGGSNEEKTERETLLRIRRESEQFDLEKKRGEHIPIAFLEQIGSRYAQAITPIDDLPDMVANVVPPDVAVSVRETVRLQVKQVRTSVAAIIEQAVKGPNAKRK